MELMSWVKAVFLLSFLSILPEQAAEAAPARGPSLVCSSPAKGCVSCSLQPPSARVSALMRLPNLWTLISGRQRIRTRNQTIFQACGITRTLADVQLRVIQGRRTIGFSRRVRVSQKEIPATPTPVPPTPIPTSTPFQPAANILSPDQFLYLGSAILPQSALGRSTGFEVGLLASRKVGTELRFFNDTHIYSYGELYEFRVPSFSTSAPFPPVESVKEWGSVYGRSRVDSNNVPYESGPPVNGLFWDSVRQGLWWAYGEPYNTQNRNAPSVGFSAFSADGNISPQSALRLHPNDQANHWTRGCVTQIPSRYADALGGRRLAAGCGGYYSIIAGGSWGPAITAFDPNAPQDRVVLLGYPVSSERRAPRPGDYFIAESAGAGSGWMGPNPNGSAGKWTGADEIGGETSAGSVLFLDLNVGRGVMFWASQGTGRIGYDSGAITSTGRKNRLYVYDPEKLLQVYRGERDLAIEPEYFIDWPTPGGFLEGRVAGIAQDPDDSSVFYMLQTGAIQSGPEFYPVIHKYRLTSR